VSLQFTNRYAEECVVIINVDLINIASNSLVLRQRSGPLKVIVVEVIENICKRLFLADPLTRDRRSPSQILS